MVNIELGRAGLLEIPKNWLLKNIKEAIQRVFNLDDYWEYQRLLEVLWKIDKDLVYKFIIQGLDSSNVEVRESTRNLLHEFNKCQVPFNDA